MTFNFFSKKFVKYITILTFISEHEMISQLLAEAGLEQNGKGG